VKTFIAKKQDLKPTWYLVDADDKILGRMATKIANLLRGKEKAIFTPHVDTGDFVVVINAAKVKLSGRKEQQKSYARHTGYPGGLRVEPVARVRVRHPERMIEYAVAGMMPKNRLGKAMLKKLKIYAGAEHPHAAQNPKPVKL